MSSVLHPGREAPLPQRSEGHHVGDRLAERREGRHFVLGPSPLEHRIHLFGRELDLRCLLERVCCELRLYSPRSRCRRSFRRRRCRRSRPLRACPSGASNSCAVSSISVSSTVWLLGRMELLRSMGRGRCCQSALGLPCDAHHMGSFIFCTNRAMVSARRTNPVVTFESFATLLHRV